MTFLCMGSRAARTITMQVSTNNPFHNPPEDDGQGRCHVKGYIRARKNCVIIKTICCTRYFFNPGYQYHKILNCKCFRFQTDSILSTIYASIKTFGCRNLGCILSVPSSRIQSYNRWVLNYIDSRKFVASNIRLLTSSVLLALIVLTPSGTIGFGAICFAIKPNLRFFNIYSTSIMQAVSCPEEPKYWRMMELSSGHGRTDGHGSRAYFIIACIGFHFWFVGLLIDQSINANTITRGRCIALPAL